MSEAPERIWAYTFTGTTGEGKWHSFDPVAYVGECTEYIRKDVHDAAVAAEREACAEDALREASVFELFDELKRRDKPPVTGRQKTELKG